jgi:site-specific recombinase XerD
MQLTEARGRYTRWLAATRNLSPHTLRAYEADVSSLERSLGSEFEVAEISSATLISYLEGQRDSGLSPRSLRRRSSALRGFSRWLLSEGLLAEDPWHGARVRLGNPRRLPRALPSRELNRLLDFLRATMGLSSDGDVGPKLVRQRPFESTTLLAVALLLATGVRVHEVVGFKCRDIDLASGQMRLVGKGRRERQVFLTNEWITNFTASYIDARSSFDLHHPLLLFNVHRDPLTPAALRSRLAKAAASAGLSTRVTPHMLRHTAATQLIEAGVDIRYIQRLLGHASLTTTEIYTHVSDKALKRALSEADVLGRFVQGR